MDMALRRHPLPSQENAAFVEDHPTAGFYTYTHVFAQSIRPCFEEVPDLFPSSMGGNREPGLGVVFDNGRVFMLK